MPQMLQKKSKVRYVDRTQSCRQGFRGSERYVLKLSNVLLLFLVPVNVVLGKKEYIYRQQLLKDILYNPELFLVWSITIFVVLNVKVLGVSRFDQSFGIYKCQKLICRNCRGQPSDCLEEEGKSLLFSSILKRLQSEVSQHVGDTSRGVVFVTSFGS